MPDPLLQRALLANPSLCSGECLDVMVLAQVHHPEIVPIFLRPELHHESRAQKSERAVL